MQLSACLNKHRADPFSFSLPGEQTDEAPRPSPSPVLFSYESPTYQNYEVEQGQRLLSIFRLAFFEAQWGYVELYLFLGGTVFYCIFPVLSSWRLLASKCFLALVSLSLSPIPCPNSCASARAVLQPLLLFLLFVRRSVEVACSSCRSVWEQGSNRKREKKTAIETAFAPPLSVSPSAPPLSSLGARLVVDGSVKKKTGGEQ